MAAQAGLCLASSETPENTFCRVGAHWFSGFIIEYWSEGPLSSKVVRYIFVVNSSYFPLLYIRFTKFLRRNLFDETGPWAYVLSNELSLFVIRSWLLNPLQRWGFELKLKSKTGRAFLLILLLFLNTSFFSVNRQSANDLLWKQGNILR